MKLKPKEEVIQDLLKNFYALVSIGHFNQNDIHEELIKDTIDKLSKYNYIYVVNTPVFVLTYLENNSIYNKHFEVHTHELEYLLKMKYKYIFIYTLTDYTVRFKALDKLGDNFPSLLKLQRLSKIQTLKKMIKNERKKKISN